MPAIEQMRDFVVMFHDLLLVLVTASNRTHTARGRSRRSRGFFDRKFRRASLASLRTGQDIAIQRAIARSKPFGARRCAPAPTVVDWQLQCLEQALNLVARGETRCLDRKSVV